MYNCINEAIQWLQNQKPKTDKNGTIIYHSEIGIVITLIGQYYYGIAAKKELYYKMIQLGVIKEHDKQN